MVSVVLHQSNKSWTEAFGTPAKPGRLSLQKTRRSTASRRSASPVSREAEPGRCEGHHEGPLRPRGDGRKRKRAHRPCSDAESAGRQAGADRRRHRPRGTAAASSLFYVLRLWLLRLDSLTNYSVAPESKLESDLYPWPSWSFFNKRRTKKALDLSPNLSGGVGSNPTGCTLVEGPIGATVARQIPVLKVTRSNRVSVTTGHRRYTTQACRRNTKKEKRQRNQENMRKFKKGAPPTARGGGGKKKTMSRKKLTLKAQAAVEKGREATFMSKLFLATGGALEEKLDLGVL